MDPGTEAASHLSAQKAQPWASVETVDPETICFNKTKTRSPRGEIVWGSRNPFHIDRTSIFRVRQTVVGYTNGLDTRDIETYSISGNTNCRKTRPRGHSLATMLNLGNKGNSEMPHCYYFCCKPIVDWSIGTNPSFNAGEAGSSVKSPLDGSLNIGSAAMLWLSIPAAFCLLIKVRACFGLEAEK